MEGSSKTIIILQTLSKLFRIFFCFPSFFGYWRGCNAINMSELYEKINLLDPLTYFSFAQKLRPISNLLWPLGNYKVFLLFLSGPSEE